MITWEQFRCRRNARRRTWPAGPPYPHARKHATSPHHRLRPLRPQDSRAQLTPHYATE